MNRRVALLGLALAAASCLSPTLPLPPPDEPSSIHPSAEDPDLWTISGDCADRSQVIVVNVATGVGEYREDAQGDDGRCSYTVQLVAKRCDPGRVVMTLDDDTSQTDFAIVESGGSCP